MGLISFNSGLNFSPSDNTSSKSLNNKSPIEYDNYQEFKEDKNTNVEKINTTIKGIVWLDENNTGFRDKSNYIPLENIEIELYLYDNLDSPIATTFSDLNGNYEFNNLNMDCYLIKVNLPNNYSLTTKGESSQLSQKTLFSDSIYTDNNIPLISIGLVRLLKISGAAFFDKFKSSIYNANLGLNGISISLYNDSNKLISSTITSYNLVNGYFEFNNLLPGKYIIHFSQPNNSVISNPIYRNLLGSKGDPRTNNVYIKISKSNLNNIFIGFQKIN